MYNIINMRRITRSFIAAAFLLGMVPLHAAEVNVPADGLKVTADTSDTYVTDNKDTSNPSVLSFEKNGVFAMNGHIKGNIAINVNTSGQYFHMNSGANDFTGGTTITSGILSLKTGTELGSGTITMSPGTQLLNNYGGSNPVVANNIVALTGGNITIRAGWNGNNYTTRSSITVNGVISGAGGVNFGYEPTPGIITITGANTYTGGTKIGVDNLRTWEPAPMQGLYLVLGSDTPFSTGTVNVSGKWDGGSTDVKTYFALDNTKTDRNVTTGDLTIDEGRTLKLVQKSTTSGKTAELTVTNLLGKGTLSNQIDDTSKYGNPLTKVTINEQTPAREGHEVILDGNFDLYITNKFQTGAEFAFTNSTTDVTNTYTGDIYIQSGIVGSTNGSKSMGSGTIHLYNGVHLMNFQSGSCPVYKNNIVLEGDATKGHSVIRSGWAGYTGNEGITLDGVISGAGLLYYSDESTPGLVTLNGKNTYTGGTVIDYAIGGGNKFKGGCFKIGSDSAFGKGKVTTNYNQYSSFHCNYFILDNASANRNLGISELNIAANQTLYLTQTSTTSGKTAELTLNKLSGNGILSNVVSTAADDVTRYGSKASKVTIASNGTYGQTSFSGALAGDFDLYVSGGQYVAFNGSSPNYTGNIHIASNGILCSTKGTTAIGTGTIYMANGARLQNFNYNSNPVYDNNIVIADGATANLRGGWGRSEQQQAKMTLNGVISGKGNVVIDQGEDTPIIMVINGENTYTGTTTFPYFKIRNTTDNGVNRYLYVYTVLGSDTPFSTGDVTVSQEVRWDFNALESDRQLKNNVTIDKDRTLNITSVGENTTYLNGTYTVNGTLQLVNPTSSSVVTDPKVQLQALSVPAGNVSIFSLSPKDENSSAGKIVGNVTLEAGAKIQVSGSYNGDEIPTVTGKLTMEQGSVLALDASTVEDPDKFLMSIENIAMEEGSYITLIPNASEDFNKLIDFGTGADLSTLKFGDTGGYTIKVQNGQLWALSSNAVPEPSTLVLALLALAGLWGRRFQRR